MSQLVTTKPMELDLTVGFTWFGVTEVRRQRGKPRWLLYQLYEADGSFAVSLGLDKSQALALWVTSERGVTKKSKVVKADAFVERPAVVSWTIRKRTANRVDVSIDVHDVESVRDRLVVRVPTRVTVLQSIGSGKDGVEPSSFKLSYLTAFERILKERESNEILSFFRQRFGLPK